MEECLGEKKHGLTISDVLFKCDDVRTVQYENLHAIKEHLAEV
jgi:hypothetical protein